MLLTAGTLSAFQAFSPTTSMGVVLRLGWILLGFFWVLRAVAPDPERLMKLLSAWRVMTMLNATIAVTGQLGLTHFSALNAENRQAGFFDQPNEFAGLLASASPCSSSASPARRSTAPTARSCSPGRGAPGSWSTRWPPPGR